MAGDPRLKRKVGEMFVTSVNALLKLGRLVVMAVAENGSWWWNCLCR